VVTRLFTRKMIRDLRTRKGSLAALLVIMTIGVGVYFCMASLYRDLDDSRRRYYADYRLADFIVTLKRAPRWSVETVAAFPNVREARGRVQQAVLIEVPGREQPVSGTALSLPMRRAPVLNGVWLRSGTWFSDADRREVIVDQAFAKEHGLGPGSRIRVLLLDQQHDLLVVGTAMSPEFVYLIPPGGGLMPDPTNYGVLYLPEKFLQESSDLDGAYNQIIGLAHDASPPVLDFTLRRLEEKLDAYGVVQAEAFHDQASVRFLADELTGLEVSSRIVPTLFLGVAALVLNVLMGRMVVQQRPVIGTLKALGYTTRFLMGHYLSYGVLIGLTGGACGLAFGYWLQKFYIGLYRIFFALPEINAHVYPGVILTSVGIGVIFAVLGTIRGVRYAASLAPAEAMRPPAPDRGGRIFLERMPGFWIRLPFHWKLIFRSVFRNRFRGVVNVLAATISTALILMTLCNVDAFQFLMEHEFNRVSRQDLTITLRDPVGRRGVPEVHAFPAVSQAEPQLAVACDLRRGPYQKRAGVIGLPAGHRLYTPQDQYGHPATIPRTGLVFSRKLAEIMNVTIGDPVLLRPLTGRRDEVEAPVTGIVDSYLGLSAYADLQYLSRLLGEEWAANAILVTTFRNNSDSAFLRELKRRPTVVGIRERRQALYQLQETFGRTMDAMISVMVLFAGLIAFGSVLNTALVTLSERQREVGTLRVLGYTARQVSRIFSGESYLLNSVGIALGLWAGMGLAYWLSLAYSTELYRFPVVIRPARMLTAIGIMLGFVWLAQGIVRRMIRRMEWLEVLKVRE